MMLFLTILGLFIGCFFYKILKNTIISKKFGKMFVWILCVATGIFLAIKLSWLFVAVCCIAVVFTLMFKRSPKLK